MNRFLSTLTLLVVLTFSGSLNSYAALERCNCDTISESINLKTNLLTDVVGTIGLAAEVKLNNRLSLDLSGTWNPFTFSDGVKYKHWMIRPELRYWFSRPMHHHFIGIHAIGGQFNMQRGSFPFNIYPSLRDYNYQGWAAGAGISYGYRWNFTSRLAMEGVVGIGYMHADYDKYKCGKCGEKIGSGKYNGITATHLALNFIYRFGTSHQTLIELPDDNLQNYGYYSTPDTVFVTRIDTVVATPKLRKDKFSLRLHYPLDKSEIVEEIADNAVQLDSLKSFVKRYATDPYAKISKIRLKGYASPEATVAHNLDLSSRRAKAVEQLLIDYLPEISGYIQAEGMGEDWDGLDFEGYSELMEIGDADKRERALRQMNNGETFRLLLREIFPRLRRTDCEIEYTIIQ